VEHLVDPLPAEKACDSWIGELGGALGLKGCDGLADKMIQNLFASCIEVGLRFLSGLGRRNAPIINSSVNARDGERHERQSQK
jgi:hypothetical protein